MDTKSLEKLFNKYYGEPVEEVYPLKGDGSDRQIYRLKNQKRSVIGIIGHNYSENAAFLSFSRHFRKFCLRVPEIYIDDLENGIYLEEDLGDYTFIDWMSGIRAREGFSEQIVNMYKKTIAQLPHFQIRAGRSIDFSYCYQHIEFGSVSMEWDLHYFKNRFLKIFYKRSVDENAIEKDFQTLIEHLVEETRDNFLYRDFQSRNVMIRDDVPHFIDYQSGRKGALQYDLASILYDAKANVPQEVRERLVEFYLDQIQPFKPVNRDRFMEYFYGFVFMRIMQAFGAYGYLSQVKGKKGFLKSVPYAIRNVEILLNKDTILSSMPALKRIFENLIRDPLLREF
ncbi:phosphotransferase [candidate division KSB1 bacterium]|nr:phosphotransferase [candidate division KSB1 bacterium]